LEATGYDANWRKWSVGVACILLSLQSMLEENPAITRYDFLSWEFEYKRRLGNSKWMEANYYAFPYAFRSRLIHACLKANIVAADRLRHISHWLGLRFLTAASRAGAAQLPRSPRMVRG
jgi:CelD/BcsL family acetyltransferase involved in cellulose biosynthesis